MEYIRTFDDVHWAAFKFSTRKLPLNTRIRLMKFSLFQENFDQATDRWETIIRQPEDDGIIGPLPPLDYGCGSLPEFVDEVQTSIMPVDNDTYQKIGASMQPLYGRPGQAKEIASLVAYLLSDEATFISGANIKADGLWSMSGGSFS